MKMKCVFAGVVLSALTLQAATVDRMLVRQEWPWNEKVDIDFALSGVAAKTEIDCAVYRGGTRLDLPLAAFSGDVCNLSKDGIYRIVFDPSFLPERPAPLRPHAGCDDGRERLCRGDVQNRGP